MNSRTIERLNRLHATKWVIGDRAEFIGHYQGTVKRVDPVQKKLFVLMDKDHNTGIIRVFSFTNMKKI